MHGLTFSSSRPSCSRMLSIAGVLLLMASIGACRPKPTPDQEVSPTSLAAVTSAAVTSAAVTEQADLAPSEESPPTDVAPESAEETPAATLAPTSTIETSPTEVGEPPTESVPDDGSRYAVVGVAVDDTLSVRAAAGVEAAELGSLSPHAVGLRVTAEGQAPDGGTWARIAGGAADGWVNRRFLAFQSGQPDVGVAARANAIIQALSAEDYTALAKYVHPDDGLRFSPYAFVEDDEVVLSPSEVASLASDATVRNWGEYQAVGGPISGTYAEYAAEFVLDADFASAPSISFGERLGTGSTIDNISEAYPGATFVEYHFDGFEPEYAGFDWVSLRIVLQQHQGEWMLVGLVHDEWTT